MKLRVMIRPGREAGWVQAYCPDLPGCSASASNEDEALRLLQKRIGEYFSADREEALPPKTRRVVIEV